MVGSFLQEEASTEAGKHKTTRLKIENPVKSKMSLLTNKGIGPKIIIVNGRV